MVSLQPISATSAYPLLPSQVISICDLQRLALYWYTDCNWTTKSHSQRTSHMKLSATSTMVTGPVGECLQAGTKDAPVLDRPAPLRRLHDSDAGHKYPDLTTYLLTAIFPLLQYNVPLHTLDLWVPSQFSSTYFQLRKWVDLQNTEHLDATCGNEHIIYRVCQNIPAYFEVI